MVATLSTWANWFDPGDFMPHGHCYLWNPGLVRLHSLSDLAIGLSYIVISLGLIYFVAKAKKDISFSWIFVCFGLFILACAGTHFMEIWTLWTPLYWLSGMVKLVTAVASVATALALPPLMPKSLSLIRAAKLSEQRKIQLESANRILQKEIAERTRVEAEIRDLNAHLEARVRGRTAELARANSNLANYAAIIESSHDAMSSWDLDQRITSWNPAAEVLYGYRAEEVLGQPISMLIPAGAVNPATDLTERLRRGERIGAMEMTRVGKSGELIEISFTISPIRNEFQEFHGVSIISRTLTDRQRDEAMFRLAVEASPSGMIMVDRDGGIVMVNSQTEKLFGYDRQELIGRQVTILVPPAFRDRHPTHQMEYLRSPLARAMSAGRDLFGLRKDGSTFPIEIGLNPIETPRGKWVLSAIVDVTARKSAEEEITRLNQDLERRVVERTAELTAVNSELEAFTYSVSHDLRAPLRQIAGFSKIIVEECGPDLNPEGKGYLRRVQDGAQQMGRLIDDLLNLSKVGRQAVSRRPAPLNKIVDAALDILQPAFADRKVEWRIGSLPTLDCDPGLFKQIFVNLFSNALKFSVARDPAIIEVGETMVEGEPTVFVRDNGAGFDMQYADKLFGVFQRLHKPRDFEGDGVGLAIVNRIVQKHGGRIWAKGEVDKGATFFLRIPPGSRCPPESELSEVTNGNKRGD